MVILGVILRGDPKGGICDSYEGMVLGGDSYEKSCWKWSRRYSMTTDRSMGNHNVILGVILGVILRAIYEILMIEMVVGDDSYEKSCWKWSRNHCGTTDRSMGNHHGDPRGDP